jgi:hypothetical protein
MNASELLNKFDKGAKMSTMELTQLSEGLRHCEYSLRGHGDMFKGVVMMCSYKAQDVEAILDSREG